MVLNILVPFEWTITYNFLVGGFNPIENYISQIGSFPQVGVNIKNLWNHHLVFYLPPFDDLRFNFFNWLSNFLLEFQGSQLTLTPWPQNRWGFWHDIPRIRLQGVWMVFVCEKNTSCTNNLDLDTYIAHKSLFIFVFSFVGFLSILNRNRYNLSTSPKNPNLCSFPISIFKR